MQKLIVWDGFCGAGGAGKGYKDVGFYVVGCDIAPQPHYAGDEFHQADAIQVLQTLVDGGSWEGYTLKDFALLHVSPPCQEYSVTRYMRKFNGVAIIRPMLVQPVYDLLRASGVPWVLENVDGAPMPDAIELCGVAFGLPLIRHRYFSSSELLFAPPHCKHPKGFYNVVGGKVRGYGAFASKKTYVDSKGSTRKRESYPGKAIGQMAMGIDWMTIAEMSEAIPPVYTEYLGRQLLTALERRAA